jgi:transglycosylase-like protein with SLT domain
MSILDHWRVALGLDELEAQQGLPEGTMTAIMRHESAGNPGVTSPVGAKGLFQLMPDTAQAYKADPYDPYQAAPAAAKELGSLYRKYQGDMPKVLAAWNWGQGNLDRQGLSKAPQETKTFLGNVLGMLGPRAAEAASGSTGGDAGLQQRVQQHLEMLRGGAPAETATAPAPERPPGSPLQPPIEIRPRDVVTESEQPSPATPPGDVPMVPRVLPGNLDESIRQSLGLSSPEAPTSRPLDLPTLAKGAAATGISGIGGVGGAALGTTVGAPFGLSVPLGILGEAGGSYAARWLNVKLGLEEPGTLGDVLSVATPVAGRAVLGAGKALVRNLPGASAIGHELGEQALEQLPGRYAPQTASRTLFQQAAGQNPPLPVGNLNQAAAAIVQHENSLAPGFRQPKLRRAAQDLTDVIAGYQGRVPMQVLEDYRQRLGLMIGQASEENWPQLAGLRRMYAALHSDLEQAALQGTPGAQTLREAIHASRQEHALDELTNLWSPGRGITTVEGNLANVHGRRILDNFDNLMARDRTFAGSFTPEQAQEIRTTLQDVARMTNRSPTERGPLAGQTMQWVGRAIGLERAIHADPASAIAIGLTVEAAPYAIAALLQTAPGRAAVRQAFLQGDGRLTSAGLAILNQALRQQFPETQSPGAAQGGTP